MAYLDKDGVRKLWAKVKALFNKGVTDISINGKTVTITKGDGSTSTQTTKDTEYSVFMGATNSADGSDGLVPAPKSGKQDSFLKGDGTWGTPENTKYNVVSKTAAGLAPQLPNETSTTKYLRQDGTWAVPPNDNTTYSDATQTTHGLMSANDKKKLDGVEEGANKYVHPTSPGHKHIPSGGSSGQILRWSADGTAVWGADSDTTYNVFKGATASNKGQKGLVPEPQVGANKALLFGNGVWSNVYLDFYNTGAGGEIILEAKNTDIGNVSSVVIPLVSASQNGLMTTGLFSKLNGLPTGTELENTYADKNSYLKKTNAALTYVSKTSLSTELANYAKKTDITNMYVYKGSVADASKLPTTGQQVGWVYNIETASVYGGAGMNVAWNGTTWDALGEIFTITAITNAELDEICV